MERKDSFSISRKKQLTGKSCSLPAEHTFKLTRSELHHKNISLLSLQPKPLKKLLSSTNFNAFYPIKAKAKALLAKKPLKPAKPTRNYSDSAVFNPLKNAFLVKKMKYSEVQKPTETMKVTVCPTFTKRRSLKGALSLKNSKAEPNTKQATRQINSSALPKRPFPKKTELVSIKTAMRDRN